MSLPPDSAFMRRAHTGDAGLSIDTVVGAMVVDALHMWLWANSDPKQRGDAPRPILADALGIESPQIRGRTNATHDELYERLKALREQEM